MRCRPLSRLTLSLLLVCPPCLRAAAADGPFDPARHMRVSEVTPGMKGYGLSVFSGTKIERFEVEVISVLRNFNPKHDVILIRCKGANLEHSGAVSGMSGSPIYLNDGTGRERMVGAFAYGWSLLKDPLAGVQPIEYMLEVPTESKKDQDEKPVATSRPHDAGRGAGGIGADARHRSVDPMRWSLGDVIPLPGRPVPKRFPFRSTDTFEPNPSLFANQPDPARLRPLASPLMVAGVPSGVLESMAPLLRAHGMIPLQAGGGSARPDARHSKLELEPGSVLAVPLVTGDVDFTAIGTVTEVIGDRVYGLGHPFVNEGPTELPMGTGEINGVLARLDQSMKLGSLVKLKGAINSDQSVGVGGAVGEVPGMAPVELRVTYSDGSQDATYRYHCARHPRLTPMLTAAALGSAMSGERELPQHHTLDYELELEFGNGELVKM